MRGREASDVVSAVRALYPQPTSAGGISRPVGAYCVGGAWMCYMGEGVRSFPSADALAVALCQYTGHSQVFCITLAMAIVDANDAGDFETAWRLLGHALEGPVSSRETFGRIRE